MSDRELMQQALEALDNATDAQSNPKRPDFPTIHDFGQMRRAADALRARLTEPDDEPVAWMDPSIKADDQAFAFPDRKQKWPHLYKVPLYTRPAARKVQPLTPEQIAQIAADCALVTPSDLTSPAPSSARMGSPETAMTDADRTQWQPIETAPTDGTEFLAFKAFSFGPVICVCTWLDADHPYYEGETPHVCSDHSGFWDATHWMPLPPAPTGANDD